MRWRRWFTILGGFTFAAGVLHQSTCVLDLPNSIIVEPPPVVVDDGDDGDDDGTCIFADCEDE